MRGEAENVISDLHAALRFLSDAQKVISLWHPVSELPPLFPRGYGDESWWQSPRLLLSNAVGNLTLGYCISRSGEISFDADQHTAAVVAWMLAPIPPPELLAIAEKQA
jgi:hypothetical protein